MITFISQSVNGTTERLALQVASMMNHDTRVVLSKTQDLPAEGVVVMFVPTYENFKAQRENPHVPVRYIKQETEDLIEKLSKENVTLLGVATGNRTFGPAFCASAYDMIRLGVRVIAGVELSGDEYDWNKIVQKVDSAYQEMYGSN